MTGLLVVAGAAVGAPARLLVARAVPGVRATLLVNVLGSLVLGLCAGLAPEPYALLGIGFCGALTTFSTFAVEVVELPRRTGAGFVALSLALCLGAAAVGLALS